MSMLKKFYFLSLIFVLTLFTTALFASIPEYWDDNGSKFVACVVSYEKITKLQNGEPVSIFTTAIDEPSLDFDGVIFQIVAPKKYRGKFLRLKNIKEYDALNGWKPPVYKIGTFFYFDRNQDAEGFTLEDYFFELSIDIPQRDMYSPPAPPYTGSTPGERYYLTADEAYSDRLGEIEGRLSYSRELETIFTIAVEALEKNRNRSPEDERIYRHARSRNRKRNDYIKWYQYDIQRITRQLEGQKTVNQTKECAVKASLPEYWDNNGSNIVACVVSYEKITKLQN